MLSSADPTESGIQSDVHNREIVVVMRQVRKRDGKTEQGFEVGKIEAAMRAAWRDTVGRELDASEESKLTKAARIAVMTLPEGAVDVEVIQDNVEVALMKVGAHKVAKAYILYRQQRTEMRSMRQHPDPHAVADYIHAAKYARYRRDLQRREVHNETVDRVEAMHLRRFAHFNDAGLEADIRWAFDQVREERVLPSMRSMQFGGKAIEVNNNRMYNCSFTFIDRPRAFAESFFLLLCGCGVGYSVQFEHVDKLPTLTHIDEKVVAHHTVTDSIEGWGDALYALISSYMVTTSPYYGRYVEFNFSKVRDEGNELLTSGGKAPGHLPLKRTIEAVRAILHAAQGRQLRPIECHDMQCHSADAVLSGGIRRSAMICLFSLNDSEMMYAKTGKWHDVSPWRSNANNSVMLKRDEVKQKDFNRIFKMTRQWGEPGFYFTADYDYGANPCVEIGLDPKLVVTQEMLGRLLPRFDVNVGQALTGWAFCNLCEMNAAMFETADDFLRAAKAATIIGTCQASYTEFPYLGPVSELIAERDALLGVSMTGIMDSPEVALNEEIQRQVASQCVVWNQEYAARIGIRPAARVTCVKPSGTTAKKLRSAYGPLANGISGHHARRYILRIIANELEPVFKYFRQHNQHMCVRKPNGDWVIEFPTEVPPKAKLKGDLTALEFLEIVKRTQENWVLPGTARPDASPGLNHNVSNTCVVKADEWDAVAEYLWQNRNYFTGVSLLAATGDKDFAFAPQEAVVTDADEHRWNQLVAAYQPVDYTKFTEETDGTNLQQEVACAGGACEWSPGPV